VISRVLGADRRRVAILRRVDRPAAIALAIAQALVAAAGWFAEPLWLSVAIAGQLVLGGILAVRVIGPARSDLGLARYAIPATAGISATLFGRLIPGGLSLLLVPLVAVLLWVVTYMELRAERGTGGRTISELLLTSIVYAGAAGILVLFGPQAWPSPILLIAALAIPPALRSAEARGVMGVAGVGQTLLHVLVIVQIGAAVVLLNMPIHLMGALIAYAFYVWSSAAETLRSPVSGRSVAIEFGALLLVGLVAGLLMHHP
jgi:hypothetical protein